jgi:hypothetical protein
MKTKYQIKQEIAILETLISRWNMQSHRIADANSAELKRDALQEIHDSMQDYQLAECDHLFISE